MCTLIMLRRPNTAWPLLVAANRDELKSRAWAAPGRHWPDRAEVVAGRDLEAGGSWLGVNDHGVLAAVLNRVGTLGAAAGKRSRGELVLDALDFEDARSAASALAELDPDAYRPFNLIVADAKEAFWLRHAGGLARFGYRDATGAWREVANERVVGGDFAPLAAAAGIELRVVPTGLTMLTAHDLDDEESARIRLHRPRFAAAPVPDPASGDWGAWAELLASTETADGDRRNAMTILTDGDYGTVCASLIALPDEGPPRVWFAAGPPVAARFEPVAF